MRIAVFHNLPSGGAKRALAEHVRRLSATHVVDVYAPSIACHEYADLRPFSACHQIYPFRPAPSFRRPFGLFNFGVRAVDLGRMRGLHRTMAQQIDSGGYDVALVTSDQLMNTPAILQFLQAPTVYYCHDPLRRLYDPPINREYNALTGTAAWADRLNPLKPWYLRRLGALDRSSLLAADLILTNSHFMRESLYRIYGRSAKVCYLGIDNDLFCPQRQPRERFVLAVGSVNPIKGFDFLIASLARVPAEVRPQLLIVGNFAVPDEHQYLMTLAARHGVDVKFKIMVEDAELVGLYRRAQMTLCAPVLEPFGFTPLESMACGTPVVGVAEGGIRETVRDGETGFLVDRDADDFAAAMVRLLTDPDLTEAMGQRGVDYVRQRWNWTESAACLEHHLRMTAGRPPAPTPLN